MEKLLEAFREKLGEEVFTEELASEIKTNFEILVNEKLKEKEAEIKKELEEKNVEELEAFKETMIESIDSYIDYAADEYLKENKVEIESATKVELAEKFLNSIKDVFANSGLEVPTEKVDLISGLEEKVTEAKSKLNTVIEENIELKKKVFEKEQKLIFEEKIKELEVNKVSVVEDLMEGLEFNDIEDYSKKLDIIVEKVINTNKQSKTSEDKNFEELEEKDEKSFDIDKYLK
jgi:hypothetical protein